ncbi:MAG: sensor histidine kinase [Proteobacteria bacterium]|nr:sensor histidine kinase [Pseudomonadota bacterium]
MGISGTGTVYLIAAQVAVFLIFLFSEKIRRYAEVFCCALLGLFFQRLLSESGRLAGDDWDIMSACIFALSFSFIGWSAIRKNVIQSEAGHLKEPTESPDSAETAVHNDRLRTLGMMNARLVHEMSHPLSTLALRFEELRRLRAADNEAAFEKSIRTIQRQLAHLNHLTNGMRQFASDHRNQNTGFVALEEVCSLTGEFCELMANELDVKVSWPEVIPEIDVSGGLTLQTQILLNLVKNAIEAASVHPDASFRWVRVVFRERGGSVEISVSNGGPRLNRAVQNLLFKPFFSGKKTGRGMGIGLTLCRELAESIGGEIWYDSDAKNPTFVVRYSFLPRVHAEPDGNSSESEFYNLKSA